LGSSEDKIKKERGETEKNDAFEIEEIIKDYIGLRGKILRLQKSWVKFSSQ